MATAIIQIPVEPKVAQAYAVSAPQIQMSIQQLGQQMISSLVFQSPSGEDNRALYAQDFFTWTQTTATLIRAGSQWYNIDRETLAEEVESLGISQKHALGSHLKNLVMHLLKWRYQPSGHQTGHSWRSSIYNGLAGGLARIGRAQTGHSWRSSIYNARDEIAVILEDSPSLRREVPGLLARRHPAARMLAHDETGLSLAIFPETCPWTPEQVLDADFWPEAIP